MTSLRTFLTCLALLVLGQVTCADEIHVGAWNIEWLGFPEKRANPGKGVSQDPADLAANIAKTGVDVLSLEEIGVNEDHAPWKSRQLDAVIEKLKSNHKQEWKYVLFAKTNYPEGTEDFVARGQHIGLAWRSDKATMIGEPFEVPVGTNETYGIKFFERRANAIKLSFGSGKTDVVFVPVHLKSNRNDANPSDAKFTQKQRTAELEVFVKQLKVLQEHFHDQDIVVLGDTNFLDGESSSKVLVDAGFKDLNGGTQGTTAVWGDGSTGYKTAPFDRIFVPSSQPEFASSEIKVHRTEKGTDDEIKSYRKKLSDHYLVSCTVSITADDD